MKRKINVTIVDDHEHFRELLIMLLKKDPNINVINEVSSGDQFFEVVEQNFPDVVLMDVELTEMDGIETSKFALQLYPNLKIIGVTLYTTPSNLNEMKKIGITSIVAKDRIQTDLIPEIYKAVNQNKIRQSI